eukprot:CAMPEP_0118946374 /NCGR_PEP_ID=MMETSP1169-20130426/44089_1 /TAXON_ID=36882 /ORGANISM="Pyramimonas obovata, Strain CCMP722" /LENGTH=467 /DNA_ID=CAMNT_0006892329 /DNA_START=95 /DNA_END=1495 /DNA_ORIENTATION=-
MLEQLVAGVDFQVSISERALKTWKKCKILLIQEHERQPQGVKIKKEVAEAPLLRFVQAGTASISESFPEDISIKTIVKCEISRLNLHSEAQYQDCCIILDLYGFFPQIFLVAPSYKSAVAFVYDMKVLLACVSVYKNASDYKPLSKDPSAPPIAESTIADEEDGEGEVEVLEDQDDAEGCNPVMWMRLKKNLVSIPYSNPRPTPVKFSRGDSSPRRLRSMRAGAGRSTSIAGSESIRGSRTPSECNETERQMTMMVDVGDSKGGSGAPTPSPLGGAHDAPALQKMRSLKQSLQPLDLKVIEGTQDENSTSPVTVSAPKPRVVLTISPGKPEEAETPAARSPRSEHGGVAWGEPSLRSPPVTTAKHKIPTSDKFEQGFASLQGVLYPKVSLVPSGQAPHSFARRHQKVGVAVSRAQRWMQGFAMNMKAENKVRNERELQWRHDHPVQAEVEAMMEGSGRRTILRAQDD